MKNRLLQSRRGFLTEVGRGMLVTTLGVEVAGGLGLGTVLGSEPDEVLSFGDLEPMVRLMQELPGEKLLGRLVEELGKGCDLRRMVAAAALANARTFGGEDYVGYHTVMALGPAFHMSQELAGGSRALPLLKVIYRNATRIQECGGRQHEVLHPVSAGNEPVLPDGDRLREQVRGRDMDGAERMFAGMARSSEEGAFNALLHAVQDATEVHRVVLPYRAWDLVGIIGREHAHALLRQSVRYCVRAESPPRPGALHNSRDLLPALFDEYHLHESSRGSRFPDAAWVENLSKGIFESSPSQAAGMVAAALKEGWSPPAMGEAITLAANQLVLRDHGRTPREESPGKPVGSVHGDSIGVHACDSANAWRNMALAGNDRNCFASLILGAFQVALDRVQRGGDFLHWDSLPVNRHVEEIRTKDPGELLRDAESAIRGNLQARASALIHRYGELGYPERPVFDLMLRYAVSEDGSLHAEKFYQTVREEFDATRPEFRWRHLVALARVTASEYGRPAPGIDEARRLLRLS